MALQGRCLHTGPSTCDSPQARKVPNGSSSAEHPCPGPAGMHLPHYGPCGGRQMSRRARTHQSEPAAAQANRPASVSAPSRAYPPGRRYPSLRVKSQRIRNHMSDGRTRTRQPLLGITSMCTTGLALGRAGGPRHERTLRRVNPAQRSESVEEQSARVSPFSPHGVLRRKSGPPPPATGHRTVRHRARDVGGKSDAGRSEAPKKVPPDGRTSQAA